MTVVEEEFGVNEDEATKRCDQKLISFSLLLLYGGEHLERRAAAVEGRGMGTGDENNLAAAKKRIMGSEPGQVLNQGTFSIVRHTVFHAANCALASLSMNRRFRCRTQAQNAVQICGPPEFGEKKTEKILFLI